MDNAILISKYIQKALEESTEIQNILGTDQHKIFPLLQPDNLTFPFIVHARNSLTVTYTKDMHMGYGWSNTVQYTISCVSNEYIQCIELANAVRHTLEAMSYKDNDICISPITLLNVAEYTVDDNTFVEELQFQMQVE